MPIKVALIHDWLNGMRGGEKVLESLCRLYPDAVIHTLIYEPDKVSPTIQRMKIITVPWLNNNHWIQSHFRTLLPLLPSAIESFDLQGFDLIISTSHCVAKGIIPPPNAIHICYCFTPVRYVWDKSTDYLKDQSKIVSTIFPWVATSLRTWDTLSANRVNYFIAISNNISRKIDRYYRRHSLVIFPPCDCHFFIPAENPRSEYFLVVSALVPYKRVDLAISACNELKIPLRIVGDGPEKDRLMKMAGPTISFLGKISNDDLRESYQNCKALLFPGEEDFGIVPLEAMSCGKPVIGYNSGGLKETLQPNVNGIFFEHQTPADLIQAIQRFNEKNFNSNQIRETALPFDKSVFENIFKETIEDLYYSRHNKQDELSRETYPLINE